MIDWLNLSLLFALRLLRSLWRVCPGTHRYWRNNIFFDQLTNYKLRNISKGSIKGQICFVDYFLFCRVWEVKLTRWEILRLNDQMLISVLVLFMVI